MIRTERVARAIGDVGREPDVIRTSPREILTTLPLGLAASYLRERVGSVRAPIAFHSAHNAIVCALLLVG